MTPTGTEAAIGGLGLLHAFVRDKQLILQHFSIHTAMITETRRQSGRAIQVHVMRAKGVAHTQVFFSATRL